MRPLVALPQLPNCVEQGAIHPLHHRYGAVRQQRFLRWPAANLEDLSLDILDGTDGQSGTFDGIDEILTARVDGDAALGDNDVDEFAGTGKRGDFVDDDRDAIAERGHGQNGAPGEKTILPSAN